MGRALEFKAGAGSAKMCEKLRQKLLDDRLCITGDAQIYMGARLVGNQTQVFKGREIQSGEEQNKDTDVTGLPKSGKYGNMRILRRVKAWVQRKRKRQEC